MQIALFDHNKVLSETPRIIGHIAQKKCKIIKSLTEYDSLESDSLDTKYHIDSVMSARELPRIYQSVFGRNTDSHNEIEKLGVCEYFKRFSTIVSMEDSLDYILHRISGCEIDNVRNIPKYFELSRAIMKLNFDSLDQFNFDILMQADSKLADYLYFLNENGKTDDPEETETKFIQTVMKNILEEVEVVASYVAVHLHLNQNKGTSTIRSKSFCNYVLTTEQDLSRTVILQSDGASDYKLNIKSFVPYEYYHRIQEVYAG